jgi:hypothetical protein
MSRAYLTFGDIAGKLHMLRIECTRCARRGQYSVAKLIAQHGHRGNMSKWVSDLRGDCPKRTAGHLHERCDLICPDLPKMLVGGSPAPGGTERACAIGARPVGKRVPLGSGPAPLARRQAAL